VKNVAIATFSLTTRARPPDRRKLGSVRLRRARVGDELAVAELHVRSWQVGYRGLLADDYLDGLRPADRADAYTFDVDDPLTIVAVTDRIRGFATISPGVGELRALYVDPARWRQGLGRALVVEAERRLGERNAVATLWILSGNVRARRFYEAGGWRPDGGERREPVWGATVDVVRYRKALAARPSP
jgi:GNAT superfamily N-acetyltransferase